MSLRYSAGVLLFRRTDRLEVLLGHLGGPLWAKKDTAAWSIPKGEYVPAEEDSSTAAGREFTEELGLPVPDGEWIPLGEVVYGSGSGKKQLVVWAVEADLDPALVVPGTFAMEWPPRSGRMAEFPEIDRAEWFDLDTAEDKLGKGQRPYLARLREYLAAAPIE
ncbi:NUDIX domain-containing protein [Nocardia yunnanensis]|uniref:NUDIX domain-containing protein n=1 Tax=Nocardia yunnanensis TaxID=2382165 RepID=A0A386ZBZ2_9NOCA|nr:NUDIX domain-containing protein [Nocardia yunnanensis]AYF74135.1 NUDIX domain-containing protein [Nocardia yunnanensis]